MVATIHKKQNDERDAQGRMVKNIKMMIMRTIAEKTWNSNRSSNKPFFSGNGTRFHNGGKSSFFEPVSSFALGGEMIQAKLEVGAPDSPAEREAETIADRVMRMAEPAFVQRKCTTCDDTEKIRRKPLIETISRNSSGNAAPVSGNLSSRIQNARGGGSSLDSSTQNFMSSRFGADFSNVRVHTDFNAVQMSRELSAHAFTVGNDLFFNQGKYNPGSDDGKRLLAHELTHVVQNKENISMRIQRIVIDENVSTNDTKLNEIGVSSRAEVLDILRNANAQAIDMCNQAITRLNEGLNNAVNNQTVDSNIEQILNEELGLSFNDRNNHNEIRRLISRFTQVRTTLESGYLKYTIGFVNLNTSLVGCLPGNCSSAYAFTCPGNRLIVLCRDFFNTPFEQGQTLLHEVFHIWYHMTHSGPRGLRRADASCLESFAARISGLNAPLSCSNYTGN